MNVNCAVLSSSYSHWLVCSFFVAIVKCLQLILRWCTWQVFIIRMCYCWLHVQWMECYWLKILDSDVFLLLLFSARAPLVMLCMHCHGHASSSEKSCLHKVTCQRMLYNSWSVLLRFVSVQLTAVHFKINSVLANYLPIKWQPSGMLVSMGP